MSKKESKNTEMIDNIITLYASIATKIPNFNNSPASDFRNALSASGITKDEDLTIKNLNKFLKNQKDGLHEDTTQMIIDTVKFEIEKLEEEKKELGELIKKEKIDIEAQKKALQEANIKNVTTARIRNSPVETETMNNKQPLKRIKSKPIGLV